MNSLSSLGGIYKYGSVCTLAAALMFGPAREAGAQPNSDLVTNMPVFGIAGDIGGGNESEFSGTLSLTEIHFDASTTNTVIFVGNLSGTAVDSGEGATDFLSQVVTTTGTMTAIGGTKNKCGLLNVDLNPMEVSLVGMEVDVQDFTIDVAATSGKARNLGNQLCKLSRFIEKADVNQVNKIVNKINSITKKPLTNIDITGTANGSGSFSGYVNVDRLEVDLSGNIIVSGTMSGVATVGADTTVLTGQTFQTSTTISGVSFGSKGCDTLFMDLGSVVFPDEDLTIETGEVVIHTGATQGTGKKIAKSLCNVVKKLDKHESKPMDPAKLVKKLTKNLVKINQLILR